MNLTIDVSPPVVGTVEIVSLLELWNPIERAIAVVKITLCTAVSLHAEIVWASISAENTIRMMWAFQSLNNKNSPEVSESNGQVVDPHASLLVA